MLTFFQLLFFLIFFSNSFSSTEINQLPPLAITFSSVSPLHPQQSADSSNASFNTQNEPEINDDQKNSFKKNNEKSNIFSPLATSSQKHRFSIFSQSHPHLVEDLYSNSINNNPLQKNLSDRNDENEEKKNFQGEKKNIEEMVQMSYTLDLQRHDTLFSEGFTYQPTPNDPELTASPIMFHHYQGFLAITQFFSEEKNNSGNSNFFETFNFFQKNDDEDDQDNTEMNSSDVFNIQNDNKEDGISPELPEHLLSSSKTSNKNSKKSQKNNKNKKNNQKNSKKQLFTTEKSTLEQLLQNDNELPVQKINPNSHLKTTLQYKHKKSTYNIFSLSQQNSEKNDEKNIEKNDEKYEKTRLLSVAASIHPNGTLTGQAFDSYGIYEFLAIPIHTETHQNAKINNFLQIEEFEEKISQEKNLHFSSENQKNEKNENDELLKFFQRNKNDYEYSVDGMNNLLMVNTHWIISLTNQKELPQHDHSSHHHDHNHNHQNEESEKMMTILKNVEKNEKNLQNDQTDDSILNHTDPVTDQENPNLYSPKHTCGNEYYQKIKQNKKAQKKAQTINNSKNENSKNSENFKNENSKNSENSKNENSENSENSLKNENSLLINTDESEEESSSIDIYNPHRSLTIHELISLPYLPGQNLEKINNQNSQNILNFQNLPNFHELQKNSNFQKNFQKKSDFQNNSQNESSKNSSTPLSNISETSTTIYAAGDSGNANGAADANAKYPITSGVLEIGVANDWWRVNIIGGPTQPDLYNSAARLFNVADSLYNRANFNPPLRISISTIVNPMTSINSPYPIDLTTNNGIAEIADASQYLDAFMSWSTTNLKSDGKISLTGLGVKGTVIGLAVLGRMCQSQSSGMVQAIYTDSEAFIGTGMFFLQFLYFLD